MERCEKLRQETFSDRPPINIDCYEQSHEGKDTMAKREREGEGEDRVGRERERGLSANDQQRVV